MKIFQKPILLLLSTLLCLGSAQALAGHAAATYDRAGHVGRDDHGKMEGALAAAREFWRVSEGGHEGRSVCVPHGKYRDAWHGENKCRERDERHKHHRHHHHNHCISPDRPDCHHGLDSEY